MKSFMFENKKYNLSSFALERKVSYSKLRRLCRHYKRAHVDPAVACNWMLGRDLLDSSKEAKTLQFYQDREKDRARYERFIDKVQEAFFKELCEQA